MRNNRASTIQVAWGETLFGVRTSWGNRVAPLLHGSWKREGMPAGDIIPPAGRPGFTGGRRVGPGAAGSSVDPPVGSTRSRDLFRLGAFNGCQLNGSAGFPGWLGGVDGGRN